MLYVENYGLISRSRHTWTTTQLTLAQARVAESF
jgi:hypothetical protein